MMLFECKVTHFQQKDAPFSLKKYVSNVASIRILIINHPNAHAEITVSYIEAIKGNAKYTQGLEELSTKHLLSEKCKSYTKGRKVPKRVLYCLHLFAKIYTSCVIFVLKMCFLQKSISFCQKKTVIFHK